MGEIVCDGCGEHNVAGTEFCTACHTFLGWRGSDTQAAAHPLPVPERPDTGPVPGPRNQPPRVAATPAATPPELLLSAGAPRFHVTPPEDPATLPPSGEVADVAVVVRNTSTIVDGYTVRPLDAPDWLLSSCDPVELLPGAEGRLRLRLRLSSPTLVPAQERTLTVRVQTTSHNPVHRDLVVRVIVPVVDLPMRLDVTPRLLRSRDQEVAECVLRMENPSNRAVRPVLTALDGEAIVRAEFEHTRLELAPGGTATMRVRLRAPLPSPGQETARQVTLTATDGVRTASVGMSYVQTASVSAITTLAVRLEPTVLRVRDADDAVAQVVLDNRQGVTSVRVRLEGSDPERAVRFFWTETVCDLAPGQVRAVRVHLHAWRPEAGQEAVRTFTVSASDGRGTVSAGGTLHQASSRAAIETLALHLDPTVLRLGSGRRGSLTATVDNRRGREPVRISLRARDPERALRFDIRPRALEVAAGQMAPVRISVTTPGRSHAGEVVHPFAVVAGDGQVEVAAQGSLIRSASSRRPVLGVLCTLLGTLAMVAGAVVLPWNGDGEGGLAFTANELLTPGNGKVDAALNRLDQPWRTLFERGLTAGAVLVALAAVAVFGLTGRTGRLIRIAALVAAAVVVLVVISGAVSDFLSGPGVGLLAGAVGVVLVYVGGHLVRR